jgi:hypothetical protein
VTAEYAEYLRTMPPDEPWGLRRVMKGDTFFSYRSDWTGASSADMLDFGPSDRGIRWCRPGVAPPAPEMEWRELEVCLEETRQMYLFDHPDTGSPVYAANASSVPGYGGTLYDDNTLRWRFDVSLGSAGGDGEVFMRPMKVRFLRPAAPATA